MASSLSHLRSLLRRSPPPQSFKRAPAGDGRRPLPRSDDRPTTAPSTGHASDISLPALLFGAAPIDPLRAPHTPGAHARPPARPGLAAAAAAGESVPWSACQSIAAFASYLSLSSSGENGPALASHKVSSSAEAAPMFPRPSFSSAAPASSLAPSPADGPSSPCHRHPASYSPPPPPAQDATLPNLIQTKPSPSNVGVAAGAGPASSTSFYRRTLPPSLVSFTQPLGKDIFKEALLDGYAEGYFSLVGNFSTQSEPAFCGLSSLSMVLNALEMDPGRRWKGPWRWYNDEMLECCAPIEVVRHKGITFAEFSCLARCNGLSVNATRANNATLENFVRDLERVSSGQSEHLVVSFSRKIMGQTGDGHFSPVGAYNPKKRMALILDTARFKYPSYWAPVELLFEAMAPVDKETNLPRGYFVLSPSPFGKEMSLPLLRINPSMDKQLLSHVLTRLLPRALASTEAGDDLGRLVSSLMRTVADAGVRPDRVLIALHQLPMMAESSGTGAATSTTALSSPMPASASSYELLQTMRSHPLHAHVRSALQRFNAPALLESDADIATCFTAALPHEMLDAVPEPARSMFRAAQEAEGPWTRELGMARESLRGARELCEGCKGSRCDR